MVITTPRKRSDPNPRQMTLHEIDSVPVKPHQLLEFRESSR